MQRTKDATLLVLLSLAWWPVGCPPLAVPPNPAAQGRTLASLAQRADRPEEAFLIQMRILGIEVPVGSASGSEDIWSYVEEEPTAASALGRNGFRVGLARRDHWESLERIFRQLAGRQARDSTLSVLPNNPIPIRLKPDQPAQTLWVFRADKTLTGEDYPPADNYLTLVCALSEEEPNQLIVVGQPMLRSTHETVQIEEENGVIVWVNRPKVYEMPDLTFRLSVPSHGIIVVGPGAAARRPTSVAHHFLIKERDGIEFETVLLLVPSVVRAVTRTVLLPPSNPLLPAPE